ncbi:aminodeoxychorismate synthase component I [Pseudothauera nasutitermitis]|uniref:Aminodeoxychorismate synthase component I n=1 Tax=Pseudothauera nasutitermitis TaxID=2565930 RepID=A0A4S4B1D2_9RHOO|nr:aminodeoxychorismate synthase component I [Pseudothauera nasutitermitis]THF66306.1 aminodeoxychorismate synthase component I [Pseudothauera nasutitermitis]
MLPQAPFALFDDNQDDAGDLLLGGLVRTLSCRHAGELPATLAAIDAARAQGHWVALLARYELGYALEPRLAPLLPPNRQEALLTAWVFARSERLNAAQTGRKLAESLAALPARQRIAGLADLAPNIDETRYLADVRRIQEWIRAGDCYQVNYTFALRGQAYGAPLALYDRLRRAQPVRYGAFIADGTRHLLSRSPELFLERRGERLRCRPMKGTAPCSADPATLAASEKNRAENVMIVDLIRNDLGRLAPPGGVRVEALCDIEAYPSVWQMVSTVSAAPVHAGLGEILRALFPCGSITGAPRIRAMEIIHTLEAEARGAYCGAIGWLAPDGDLRLNVAIRTLEIEAGGNARMGLGSGIVADSDPADEWRECLLKGRFVHRQPPGYALIETLRCEPQAAAPYPLLEMHLDRLERSAAALGFSCSRAAARAALLNAAEGLRGLHRVRLELTHDGRIELRCTALDEPPEVARLQCSPSTIDSADVLLRHKTTAREPYDRELAQAAATGCFDLLYFNERGELTEGARSCVFVEFGDGLLYTPPLSCGLLDSVWRRYMLAGGRARERVLTRADLRRASRLWVGNALRGLLPAVLEES